MRRLFPVDLGDAGQAEHVSGEILVVVAVDVVGVHGGGRDVVERHAGHGADLPALRLELVEQGGDEPAVVGDVHPVVVGLDPGGELAGALRRVGVGVDDAADGSHAVLVGLVARLPLEVARRLGAERPEGPRVRPADARVVAAANAVLGDRHRLGVVVGRVLVVRRAGHVATEPGGTLGRVVLEGQAGPFPFPVNPARLRDRGGPGGVPVHAVEPDDEEILDALRHGVLLDPVEVALVGVFGLGVDGPLGEEAVKCLDLGGVPVDAVRPGHGAEVDLPAEGIDRDQAVRVAGVVREDVAGPLRAEVIGARGLVPLVGDRPGLELFEFIVGRREPGGEEGEGQGEGDLGRSGGHGGLSSVAVGSVDRIDHLGGLSRGFRGETRQIPEKNGPTIGRGVCFEGLSICIT